MNSVAANMFGVPPPVSAHSSLVISESAFNEMLVPQIAKIAIIKLGSHSGAGRESWP